MTPNSRAKFLFNSNLGGKFINQRIIASLQNTEAKAPPGVQSSQNWLR